MTREDAELLEHYVRRGAEPWNQSLEAAWLDYELRSFVLAKLPARRPLAVCNVGIGAGLWDDWLARVVGAPITSVDPRTGQRAGLHPDGWHRRNPVGPCGGWLTCRTLPPIPPYTEWPDH